MERLSVELIEEIVSLVDLNDACALRLCSRELCAKASQGRFRRSCGDKRLYLTDGNLRDILTATSRDGVGCCLKKLTIVGVCYDPQSQPGDTSTISEQIRLLTKAFRNIKAFTDLKKLEILSLEMVVRVDGKDFAPTDAIGYPRMVLPGRAYGKGYPKDRPIGSGAVWKTCACTFQVAGEALSRSGLVVDELRIFTNVLHCSLACDKLVRAAGGNTAWPLFTQTKRLALSVSHHSCGGGQRQRTSERVGPDSKNAGECHAKTIVRFLAAFPNLRELELQWYSISTYQLSAADLAEQNFLSALNAQVRWPALRTCTLKGFRTPASLLLGFFKRHTRLTHVTLEGIYLSGNQGWRLRPLLGYFARQRSRLEYLCLVKIWEGKLLIFRDSGFWAGDWEGKQARREVKYALSTYKPSGELGVILDRAEERRAYGPP